MTPAKDSGTQGRRRQEDGADRPQGQEAPAGGGPEADSKETERELRAGGAAAGIGAGAAVGGVEGAAVASGLEAGKSLGDEAKTASQGTKGRGDGSGKPGGAEKPSSAAGSSQTGGAAAKAGSAAVGAKGAARSAMNVAAADSKRAAAAKGAGEAMKRSGSSTVKAAGTVLSADGSMTDKAQQGAALAAGIAAAGAVSSTGVGTVGAKVAAEATTRVVGSQTARRHGWKVLLLVLLLIGGPSLTAAALMAIAVPVVISSMSTEDDADDVESMCTPGDGGTMQLTGTGIEMKVWNYLIGEGWSEEQAAGVMGNIKRESQFNPFIAEGVSSTPNTSQGWGLVQWTADRHVAIRDAVKAEHGDRLYVAAPSYEEIPPGITQKDVDDLVLFQLQYISNEMSTNEKVAGDALRQATTVESATQIFEEEYERAGVVELEERITHAKGYYAQFAGSAEPAPGSGQQDLASTCQDAGASTGTPGDLNVTGEMGPVIDAAGKTLSYPYVFGGGDGAGPGTGYRSSDAGEVGYDCSGVTSYAYKQGAGIDLPRTARAQWAAYRSNEVAVSELQPGDLLFYAYGRLGPEISHVAIYIGNGEMIEASISKNEVVRVPARTSGTGWVGAARVMNSPGPADAGTAEGGDAR